MPLVGPFTFAISTTDKYEAIAAMRTAGPNYELTTSGVIHWLRKTEKTQPFIVTGIGHDLIAGQFVTAIKDAGKLAKRMIEFCPDLEDGCEDGAGFAEDLCKNRRFAFWWD